MIRKILKDIHWFEFSFIQKTFLFLFLILHVTFLFSVSNRGEYGNKLFGMWRYAAWDTSGWIARAGDFYSIYEAGHQALLGRPVFQVQPEMNSIPREESRMRVPYTATFRYPPLTAYTFAAAMNIIPPEKCYKVWVLFNEALLFLGIYLCAKKAAGVRTAFFSIAAWLCFYPIHIEYYMGQFSFFMGYLIFLCALSFADNKETKAVFWWGLSLFVKVYTIPFALYWIAKKKIKLSIIWLAVFTVTTIIYFAVFSSDWKMVNERGIKGRFYSDTSEEKPPALYWGSMGVQRGAVALVRIFDRVEINNVIYPPAYTRYLLYLVILFPFPFLIYAAFRKNTDPVLVLALFSLAWFFWYFDTWEHHYTMLLPIIAFLISSGRIKGIKAFLVYILLASPSLFFMFYDPEINVFFPVNKSLYFFFETIYYLIKPVGILILFYDIIRNINTRIV